MPGGQCGWAGAAVGIAHLRESPRGGRAQAGSPAGQRKAPQCEVAAGPRPCSGREGHRDVTGGAGRASVAVGAPEPGRWGAAVTVTVTQRGACR